MRILRLPDVKGATGYPSKSSVYALINQGLFTKPVPIGARSVGWPDHEVYAINVARVAGKSPDEIRALVNRLHQQRQDMAEGVAA